MTDECRPAAGAADGSLHWLTYTDGSVRDVGMWRRGGWDISGGRFSPKNAARLGFVYYLPASPDDATERARLEKENARLRAVADAAQEVATAVDCLETARTVPQQRQFTDEIIDAAKKLADALAALTPGDAS